MWFKLLPIGSSAPSFSLESADGQTISLSDYAGQPLVLIFYPADFTPGCTRQLCAFRDAAAQLAEQGFNVVAINPGSPASHRRFADAHQLPFPLLSDPGFKVAKLYKAQLIPGVVQNRVVYGINAQGIITFAQVGDPPVNTVIQHLH